MFISVHNTQRMLMVTYGLLFIIAGADKFMNLVTEWSKYVSPYLTQFIGLEHLIIAVGIIEIAIGILVFIKPRVGAYCVATWLVLIVLNLLTLKTYRDIAVRDLVMAVGAIALANLSRMVEKPRL